MKKGLLFIATIFTAGLSFSQNCSDLFISEYVEGWSNNKALEIYNPTNAAIDLSEYIVVRYNNGSTSSTSANTASIAVQLDGMIEAYSTYVAVIDKRDPLGEGQEAPVWDSLQVRADGFYCPVYDQSYAFYFNGNDAVVLAKGTVSNIEGAIAVDIFGKIGEDPGEGWSSGFPYTGNGDLVTIDHSMIRKPTIKQGVTNPTISFFDPLSEWDSIPPVVEMLNGQGNLQLYGNWFSLGTHECDCYLSVPTVNEVEEIKVFPNPSNGTFYVKNSQSIVNVEVVNSLGQTVANYKVTSKPMLTMDLGTNKGVYFVRFTDLNGNTTLKRVVIK